MSDNDAALDEFLSHWGVKGMRWGVRKSEDSTGDSSPSLKDIRRGVAIGIGTIAVREMILRNKRNILPATATAAKYTFKAGVYVAKSGISAARNTQQMAAGAKFALRIMGGGVRGAKSYVRGVATVARALR